MVSTDYVVAHFQLGHSDSIKLRAKAMWKDLTDFIGQKEVLAAVIGAVATGLLAGLGWLVNSFITNRREREKEGAQAAKSRAREALAACHNLRYLLGFWLDQIDEQTAYTGSVEETLSRLRRFKEGHHFQTRLKECSASLSAFAQDEPACLRLIEEMDSFAATKMNEKELLEATAKRGVVVDYNSQRTYMRRIIETAHAKLESTLSEVIRLLNERVTLDNYSTPVQFLPNRTLNY